MTERRARNGIFLGLPKIGVCACRRSGGGFGQGADRAAKMPANGMEWPYGWRAGVGIAIFHDDLQYVLGTPTKMGHVSARHARA